MSARILIGLAALALQSQSTTDVIVGPKEVQELVVRPQPKCLEAVGASAPAPKIVGILPSEGQVVRPGLLVVRVTFNRPMACDGFLLRLGKSANPCPSKEQTFIWTFDHKTVRTLCLTRPRQTYGVVVGGGCSLPFMSLTGQRAQPIAVRFSTSNSPAETSVEEALAANAGTPSLPAGAGSAASLGLDGTWQGEITDWRGRRPLVLHIAADTSGGVAAALDSPFRNIFGEPIAGFSLDGREVGFKDPAASASYAGSLSADGSAIRGLWTRDGQAIPVNFACVPGSVKRGGVAGVEEALTPSPGH